MLQENGGQSEEKHAALKGLSFWKKFLTILVSSFLVFVISSAGVLVKIAIEPVAEVQAQSVVCPKDAREEMPTLVAGEPDWSADSSALSQYEEYLKDYILEQNYKVFPQMADIIVDSIHNASREYNISPLILIGLMDVESDFDYMAQSDRNAIGLLQIHLPTWVLNEKNPINLKKVGIIQSATDLYDPQKNLRAGAFILSHYMKEADRRGVEDVAAYSITRYEGGKKNHHAKRVKNAIGEYLLFYQKQQMIALEKTAANN
ncbi:MAG: transglycosylase SLT domain-containing protein [Deltaproteobacteria bacterium]|nr:transglycosylase SLT domain-containing protein [Deltaproteobacteria bacterium]